MKTREVGLLSALVLVALASGAERGAAPEARLPQPLASGTTGQQGPPLLKRGPEHEKLDFLLGTWNVETRRFQPVEMAFESEATFAWQYGGVYLQGVNPTTLGGSDPIYNVILMTYNRREGAYVGASWDNVSADLIPFRGRWIAQDTLALDTGEIEYAGRAHRAVLTYIRISDSRVRHEMRWSWDGGELQPVFTAELRRRAS